MGEASPAVLACLETCNTLLFLCVGGGGKERRKRKDSLEHQKSCSSIHTHISRIVRKGSKARTQTNSKVDMASGSLVATVVCLFCVFRLCPLVDAYGKPPIRGDLLDGTDEKALSDIQGRWRCELSVQMLGVSWTTQSGKVTIEGVNMKIVSDEELIRGVPKYSLVGRLNIMDDGRIEVMFRDNGPFPGNYPGRYEITFPEHGGVEGRITMLAAFNLSRGEFPRSPRKGAIVLRASRKDRRPVVERDEL
mmetsp:Transcript_19489/g.49933  ORF Transcript_19489/g.49933 Transcript_19489/m.49933 type:complete len:249 (-) Transcript_19489:452-1198(-)